MFGLPGWQTDPLFGLMWTQTHRQLSEWHSQVFVWSFYWNKIQLLSRKILHRSNSALADRAGRELHDGETLYSSRRWNPIVFLTRKLSSGGESKCTLLKWTILFKWCCGSLKRFIFRASRESYSLCKSEFLWNYTVGSRNHWIGLLTMDPCCG